MKALAMLLSGPLIQPLVDKTEILYSLTMEKANKQKKENDLLNEDKTKNIGIGLALGMGAFGMLMLAKNKIF